MTPIGYPPSAATPRGAWDAPVAAGPVDATVTVPGSKSLTNRELVLAAIADGPGTLHAPLHSDDSARMIDSLRALGVRIDEVDTDSPFGPDLLVTPPSSFAGGGTVDCGQACNGMRFVVPLSLAR